MTDESATSFDVIVIGAAPAGEVLAGRLGTAGLSTAIVERALVGGECSFYAWMPSKALLRPPQAFAETRRVPGAAEAMTGSLDVTTMLGRRDAVVAHLDDAGQVPWLQTRGVTLLRGRARLAGERRVQVDDLVYEARKAVAIAVGSVAEIPPIPGVADARRWTNREATTSDTIPPRLINLGGGVVGVEMADAYRAMGSEVVVIEQGDRLVAHVEPFASDQLVDALRGRGIDVRLSAHIDRVDRSGGVVTIRLGDGTRVEGEELLVAVGRRPPTDESGSGDDRPEGRRVHRRRRRLSVSGLPWLYAIGDVNGQALLTHIAKRQAHIASERILGRRSDPVAAGVGSPQVIFTEPQTAAVGLTLDDAVRAGHLARAYDVPTSGTAGASFVGRGAPGTSRIVVDEQTGRVVGATFVGPDVSEWLHAATIAVVGKVSIDQLWHAVPAFPTRSEVWLKLLEARETELASVAA